MSGNRNQEVHNVMIWKHIGRISHDGVLSIMREGVIQKLTRANMDDIVQAVRDGVCDSDGKHHRVTKLQIIHTKFPKQYPTFERFISKLLQVPTLKEMDFFGDGFSACPVLHERQVDILTKAVSTNSTLTTLQFRCPDNPTSVQAIVKMLCQNTTMTHFCCDVSDDIHNEYQIVKAACLANQTLTRLEVPCTLLPDEGDMENFSLIGTRHGLTIVGTQKEYCTDHLIQHRNERQQFLQECMEAARRRRNHRSEMVSTGSSTGMNETTAIDTGNELTVGSSRPRTLARDTSVAVPSMTSNGNEANERPSKRLRTTLSQEVSFSDPRLRNRAEYEK